MPGFDQTQAIKVTLRRQSRMLFKLTMQRA